MAQRMWVQDPNAPGKKIPELVKQQTEVRIQRYAEKHFGGNYKRLDFRFRGAFCYIDAYTDELTSRAPR